MRSRLSKLCLFSTSTSKTSANLDMFLNDSIKHYEDIVQRRQMIALLKKIQKILADPIPMSAEVEKLHKEASLRNHDNEMVTFSIGYLQPYDAIKKAVLELKTHGYIVEWVSDYDSNNWNGSESILSISKTPTQEMECKNTIKHQ